MRNALKSNEKMFSFLFYNGQYYVTQREGKVQLMQNAIFRKIKTLILTCQYHVNIFVENSFTLFQFIRAQSTNFAVDKQVHRPLRASYCMCVCMCLSVCVSVSVCVCVCLCGVYMHAQEKEEMNKLSDVVCSNCNK
jgi:hypothetical protein